mmetsp:Transcript_40257/g.85733  ORF Transcript_40257/g.85733 Transcript_40257/m.85733 type:complete len:193 (-) Transcript_40257:2047-2625(-)
MVQRRGRPLKGFGDGSSSSDSDDDAFASISKKKKPRTDSLGGGRDKARPPPIANGDASNASKRGDASSTSANPPATAAETSSNKRHHHVSAARQAKMDALLQELQTTKPTDPSTAPRGEVDYGSIQDGDNFYGRGGDFAPHKKGSYVEPGMEHLTTNLFVGNLDPMTTEEELTDAFRQFGKDICGWLWMTRK